MGQLRPERRGRDAHYCVQLTAGGTAIYCQLVPGAVLLAYYSDVPKDDPKGFTHLAKEQVEIPAETWFNIRDDSVTRARNGLPSLRCSCT